MKNEGLTPSQLAERNALLVTEVEKLRAEREQLAAENVALKNPDNWLSLSEYGDKAAEVASGNGASEDEALRVGLIAIINRIETPATDRIVAGIKADGRAEGINFAAIRLAAAFNHGFVDKPMAEVGDVVRMILDAKADLANDPVLAADGLSGEYAEKALAEWEAELREGADK